MADDNVQHLMLEQLKRLNEKVDTLTDAVRYIHTQQLSDRLMMRSMQVSIDSTNDLLTSLVGRVGRIERRLELDVADAPAGFADRGASFDPGAPKKR